MVLREILAKGLEMLEAGQTPSAGLAAELLLMHTLGCDRGALHANPERELSDELIQQYFSYLRERLTGKPTQYITGHQEFWGLDLEVTPDVLIPRPETELLVETVLELVRVDGRPRSDPGGWGPTRVFEAGKDSDSLGPLRERVASEAKQEGGNVGQAANPPLRIVDAGTGSGCIALALASELPAAVIEAVDISPGALRVARRNAARLGFGARIHFQLGDWLSPFLKEGWARAFDFIVSNPPYVGSSEVDLVQREVREFEPRIAWGGRDDDLEVYRRLFAQAWRLVKPGGMIVVEIGYSKSEAVTGLLRQGWRDVRVRPDLAGIPRAITARKDMERRPAVTLQV